LAIIAHVDHGKTTLADALLHKAGVFGGKKDRVGDERSLDQLQDEKERGITIQSAAVRLHYQVSRNLLAGNEKPRQPPPLAAATETGEESVAVDLYVGRIPPGSTKEDAVQHLEELGYSNVAISHWSPRRAYAWVRVTTHSRTTTTADNTKLVQSREGDEDEIWAIEVLGDAPMKCLQVTCQDQAVAMPKISTTTTKEGLHVGQATWAAMGDVIIQAPTAAATVKQARAAVAQECLAFLDRQLDDHQTECKDNSISATVDSEAAEGKHETTGDMTADDGMASLIVNLIDSPGHVEFNGEVAAALRLSDGALLVVDAVEGTAVQTQEVLAQALKEGVRPLLFINKVDRLFLEMKMSPKEAYDRIQKVVKDVNSFIQVHQRTEFSDQRVSFLDGTVCMGSGYFGWSCSIDTFLPYFQNEEMKKDVIRRSLVKRENFIKHILVPVRKMHLASGALVSPSSQQNTDPAETNLERVNNLLSKILGGPEVKLVDGEDPSPKKLLKKAMMKCTRGGRYC